MTERQVWRMIVRAVLFLFVVGAVAWFAWTVRSVLVLLLVAVILAAGLSPILDAITGVNPPRRRYRLPRSLAVLLVYLALFLLFDLIVAVIIPPLIGQIEDLVQAFPAYVSAARDTLNALAVSYPFLQGLDQRLTSALEQWLAGLGGISSQALGVLRLALGLANALLSFFLLLVLTFYIIVDGRSLRDGIMRLLPPENRPLMEGVVDRAKVKVGGWLIGQLLLSAIIGSMTFLGLTILGVPYALLLAVVAAIGELIPMLGPIIAAVPAVIVALFISPVLAILTALLYLLIQQLENNVVVPQVMRRAVDLPPVVVIVALLMGSEVLGVVGAILALPVAASLSVFVSELLALRDRQLAQSGPPGPEGG